jgi:heptosyltransferase I
MSGRPAQLPQRIAIVMLSAIGDAVHVLPVITALKRRSPDSRVTWFLAPGPARLVRGHPALDEIIEFSARGGARAWRDMRRTLRGRTFDLVVDFQVAFKAGLLTAMIDARVKLGFDRERARDLNWLFTTERIAPHANQHVQDQYFEFLDHLGVPHEPVEWNLGPWPNEHGWLRRLIPETERPLVSMAVASSRPERDWLAERWADVAEALHERYGTQVVLVGGQSPAERRAEETIMTRTSRKPFSTLGCTLREMVTVIDASVLVLTPDTAASHIGNALGKPVIGIYASTDPRRTGPYRGDPALLVDGYRMPGDPDAVLMERRMGRGPLIPVDAVLEKVERWHRAWRS